MILVILVKPKTIGTFNHVIHLLVNVERRCAALRSNVRFVVDQNIVSEFVTTLSAVFLPHFSSIDRLSERRMLSRAVCEVSAAEKHTGK